MESPYIGKVYTVLTAMWSHYDPIGCYLRAHWELGKAGPPALFHSLTEAGHGFILYALYIKM